MATKRMHAVQEYNFSVEKLFSFLSVHENLSLIFAPAKVKLVKAGKDNPNGLGSVRHVVILPFLPKTEETVTNFVENKLIEYRITGASPLKNHLGTIVFTDLGNNRSRLDYHLEFDGRFPLVAPIVQRILGSAIKRGLKQIKG